MNDDHLAHLAVMLYSFQLCTNLFIEQALSSYMQILRFGKVSVFQLVSEGSYFEYLVLSLAMMG